MAAGRILALVDCNTFYASCEKVFVPSLRNRAVVVLSNNDGCVIARSAEAKAMGIPMGKPAFECHELFRRHDVAVFSSNYTLYGDLSARVMKTLARFTPNLEIYSIDEAFLDLTGMPGDVAGYSRHIRETVVRWTGIPVSIGLGPTKTLAKVANKLAKKDPALEGVLDFGTCPDPDALLERVNVEDVWGIGRRYAAMLERHGVTNARQFRDLPRDFVRKRMTVGGLHTLLELRGIPCIDLETIAPAKKSVAASRSFGKPVVHIEEMREALAVYVTRAAERMRAGRLVANGVTVWVQTNTFIAGEPQYANSAFGALPMATAHTAEILTVALQVLDRIFRKGYRYKKAGVMLSGLESFGCRQLSLLEPATLANPKGERLMAVLDKTNARWGRDTLRFAACGIKQDWKMKQAMRSPHYTTSWLELPVVKT
ncbi:Error-prone, lesion bypass DNA polymerase V (UmuC) [Desulfovibrio sp. DV]|uniref:Y-family DNA polymerase n=1 Tax=Desulfovibrio sp. DV TaxID=1844708 RepID=UPI00094B8FDE|nr:Y-family DNA polymerase [Desulfovibrio sp. DV]OLN31333.1 Error-prone, lesion bypass DNA polymerase V (UmuC) [Desulfovibrio sp. DV]